MPVKSGHKKEGGRKAGTPNKLTEDTRDVARRLLGEAEYQRSLQKRLSRGEAPRIELHLWELAYGKPRTEPEGDEPKWDLAAMLAESHKYDPFNGDTEARPAPASTASAHREATGQKT